MPSSSIAISIVQMKPKLGNINFNSEKILNFYKESHAEIVLFPELSLTGYSPRDQLLSATFIQSCHKKLNEILSCIGKKICIIGTPFSENGKLYNAVIAMQYGKIIAKSFKTHLPNYGVFEEMRYFSSGFPAFFEYRGVKFGLPICEDIWHCDVCESLKLKGVDVFLVANASPFHQEKDLERKKVVEMRYNETQIPIIYCNQVLCQDGTLYDGASFCYDGNIKTMQSFTEVAEVVNFRNGKFLFEIQDESLKNMQLLHKALIFGLREYVDNSNFQNVVIGLSGGADSALVSYLAVKAFGSENVLAIFMPSQFTSVESYEDAQNLAQNLGIEMRIISIQEPFSAFHKILDLTGTTAENIQARIRGNILMSISNSENAMVLTTGNKSEIAVGYCTIYGDMCGGYNPIKDLYKTQVVDVMKFINQTNIIIPERIITKEPSAELILNQKDSDFLPEYKLLDIILEQIIEQSKQISNVEFSDRKIVEKVWNLVKKSEYKRQQSTIGTKISKRSLNANEWKFNIV